METSSISELSALSSRSEYLSTLPRWRRLLAMLNWRPVYEYELRAIERKRRLQQLESDERREKLESETRLKLLQESNARIARFEQELFSSSNPTPSTGDSSPT
jgi:hypothetical protein